MGTNRPNCPTCSKEKPPMISFGEDGANKRCTFEPDQMPRAKQTKGTENDCSLWRRNWRTAANETRKPRRFPPLERLLLQRGRAFGAASASHELLLPTWPWSWLWPLSALSC